MSTLVSINCITYNQEDYLSDAIESFLMQKTDFDFEILIGEDCSTDNTRQVAEKYVKKYPNKVKLITSEINVGARKNLHRLQKKATGKYIALCEGDDYWTDPYKLQKQIDYMEEHPSCTMCVHAAQMINVNRKIIRDKLVRPFAQNKKCSIEEVILGGGGFFPTASIVYRKHLMDNPPKLYMQAHVGDVPLALLLSSQGHVYYINEVMSVYRRGIKGSWTDRLNSGTDIIKKRIKGLVESIKLYDNFDEYTDFKYSKVIKIAKLEREMQILALEGKFIQLLHPRFKVLLDKFGMQKLFKIYIKCFCIRLYAKVNCIKTKLTKK